MSAQIEPFPGTARHPSARNEAARRYMTRAREAFELLAAATNDAERVTLCEIAEIWLDMAEAALPRT